MPEHHAPRSEPPDDRPSEPIDPAEWQARLDQMTAVFADIMSTAAEVSTRRCPYKNRFDRCTASFGCRNQRRPTEPGGLRVCASDDRLDYRSAWESGVEPPVIALRPRGRARPRTATRAEEVAHDPGAARDPGSARAG